MTAPTREHVIQSVPAALVPAALAIHRLLVENGVRLIVPRPGAPMEAAEAMARVGILELDEREPDGYRLGEAVEVVL